MNYKQGDKVEILWDKKGYEPDCKYTNTGEVVEVYYPIIGDKLIRVKGFVKALPETTMSFKFDELKPITKFKVGDEVEIIKSNALYKMDTGTKTIIQGYSETITGKKGYKLRGDDLCVYFDDELKLVPKTETPKPFFFKPIHDLKDGMVVITRDSKKYVVLEDKLVNVDGHLNIKDYDDDFCDCDDECYDIMRISFGDKIIYDRPQEVFYTIQINNIDVDKIEYIETLIDGIKHHLEGKSKIIIKKEVK